MKLVFFVALFAPGLALADPCSGPLPARDGEVFAGQVRCIVDGDGLCVGRSADPKTWIQVRIADFNAPELQSPGCPEAKRALDDIATSRTAECITRRGRNGRVRSRDRVIAICRINGGSIGDRLRAAGIREGGN